MPFKWFEKRNKFYNNFICPTNISRKSQVCGNWEKNISKGNVCRLFCICAAFTSFWYSKLPALLCFAFSNRIFCVLILFLWASQSGWFILFPYLASGDSCLSQRPVCLLDLFNSLSLRPVNFIDLFYPLFQCPMYEHRQVHPQLFVNKSNGHLIGTEYSGRIYHVSLLRQWKLLYQIG